MKRIDALAGDPGFRLGAMTGAVLDEALDDELQALVTEASQALTVPIAMVSLVLARTQYFRAQVGLPADLAIARSTDRDASFCQFAVRDRRTFEVNEALTDARVPQELVERYGIRAYLGEPVVVGEAVVGTLCAIDIKPRSFSEEDRRHLASLAQRVSGRLSQLALRPSRAERLLKAGTRPVFAELRNLLTVLSGVVTSARISTTDLAPLVRIARELQGSGEERFKALGSLTAALGAFEELTEATAELDAVSRRLQASAFSLEGLFRGDAVTHSLAELINHASGLAYHHCKLVGGVSWAPMPPDLQVRGSRLVTVSLISSALSALSAGAMGQTPGIRGSVRIAGSQAVIELSSPGVDAAGVQHCQSTLGELLASDEAGQVVAVGTTLQLHLPVPLKT